MNAAVVESRDMEPSSAVAALVGHMGPVILDFDETLYLRNSTEDFIDSARPAILAMFLLRILDAIGPWRWTGGDMTRDVWRVRCILFFLPWTKRLWLKRVQMLAVELGNEPLLEAIHKRSLNPNAYPAIVATLGFEFIVAPLAIALGLTRVRVIAADIKTFEDRREGKLRMVARRIGHEMIRRSLVMTDSKQDNALLEECAIPLHISWSRAYFRPALSGHYFPGQYLTLVKRPGERYIARGILQEDFALWVLTSIVLSSQPIAHFFALLFLLMSFWAIYESGYVDNDRIAARYERDPKLSGAYSKASVATPALPPWIWASTSGAIAVLILHGVTQAAAISFGIWMAVLGATYGVFALYNRFDKSTRIWWYSVLQLARSAAFVALLPIHLIGAMAIGAHVLAKWLPYYIYRAGGKRWPDQSHFLTRLLFFALLGTLVAFAAGFDEIWNWSALALLAWNLFRARHELLSAIATATRLDKAQPETRFDRHHDKHRLDKEQGTAP